MLILRVNKVEKVKYFIRNQELIKCLRKAHGAQASSDKIIFNPQLFFADFENTYTMVHRNFDAFSLIMRQDECSVYTDTSKLLEEAIQRNHIVTARKIVTLGYYISPRAIELAFGSKNNNKELIDDIRKNAPDAIKTESILKYAIDNQAYIHNLLDLNPPNNASEILPEYMHKVIAHKYPGMGSIVKKFIEWGCSPNCYVDGMTPLIRAAQCGSEKRLHVIRTLIMNGADVNAVSRTTSSSPKINRRVNALMTAVFNIAPMNVIEHLIKHTENINILDDTNRSVLHYAAKHMPSALPALVEAGAVNHINEKTKARGFTALHLLVDYSSHKHIKTLVNAGACVDIKDNGNFTPFHVAIRKKNKKSVKALINGGVNINDPVNYLVYSIKNGSTEITKLLIKSGIDVNMVGNNSWYPLDYSVRYNNGEDVRCLLKYGSRYHTVSDNTTWSTGMIAVRNSTLDSVKRIYKAFGKDAFVQYCDHNVYTVISYRYQDNKSESLEILEYLLENNFPGYENVFSHDKFWSENMNMDIIQKLCEYGADTKALKDQMRRYSLLRPNTNTWKRKLFDEWMDCVFEED